MTLALAFPLFFALIVIVVLWRSRVASRRRQHIRSAKLPKGLYAKLLLRHPHLEIKDCDLAARGLRQFFMTYARSGHQYVSMPSQVADDLWHEFILHTRGYHEFCEKAFGRYLHHTPAAALGSSNQMNAGLRRCWWHACREDNIDPAKPARLPLLFALDAKLKIVNGFLYAADCSAARLHAGSAAGGSVTHCGGDFSSASVDGGTEGFGDSAGGDGGDSGGGGCGGD